MKEIRLFDLVKGVVDGNLNDEQRQYVNGSKISLRGTIQAQGEAGTGIENVPQDEKSLELAIRNASVLSKLNCAYFSNAVGDIQIPKYSGSNCGWAGEIDAASDGAGEFSEVLLQPKRLTAVLKISKTFLAQDRNSAEAVLIRDLANAVAEKLDQTIFGAASGTTTRPQGLFFDSGYTSTGETLSAITFNDVLDLELKVEEKNGNDYVFVTSPNVKQALRGVQMASGLDMVYSHNEIDGVKTVVSNSVEKGGLLVFDPRDLAVAQWSGVEITVDPYTEVANNCIRLVVNAYYDAKLKGDRIAAAIFE
jgi:HK97 family phage major capsid protein